MRETDTHAAGGAAQPAALLGARLRHETRDLHDRIEANPRFARLMAPDLGREEYVALLARLFGHHGPAEAALSAAVELLPDAIELPRRLSRTTALAADLRALGVPAAQIAALPRCGAYRLDTAEAAWGTLYVLEGATLGGQVIARHIAATLGFGPGSGAAGVVPHGAETGRLWRDFRQLLEETAALGRLDQDAVVAAARHAFATLDGWMRAA